MADVLAVTGRTPATQSPFVSAASLDATLSTASWEGDHTSWLAKTVPVSAPKVPHPGKTPSAGHTYFLPIGHGDFLSVLQTDIPLSQSLSTR